MEKESGGSDRLIETIESDPTRPSLCQGEAQELRYIEGQPVVDIVLGERRVRVWPIADTQLLLEDILNSSDTDVVELSRQNNIINNAHRILYEGLGAYIPREYRQFFGTELDCDYAVESQIKVIPLNEGQISVLRAYGVSPENKQGTFVQGHIPDPWRRISESVVDEVIGQDIRLDPRLPEVAAHFVYRVGPAVIIVGDGYSFPVTHSLQEKYGQLNIADFALLSGSIHELLHAYRVGKSFPRWLEEGIVEFYTKAILLSGDYTRLQGIDPHYITELSPGYVPNVIVASTLYRALVKQGMPVDQANRIMMYADNQMLESAVQIWDRSFGEGFGNRLLNSRGSSLDVHEVALDFFLELEAHRGSRLAMELVQKLANGTMTRVQVMNEVSILMGYEKLLRL